MTQTPEELSEEAERQIEKLGQRYLARLRAGEKPNGRALADAHPEIAGPLRRRLALVEKLYRLAPAPVPIPGAAVPSGYELLGVLGRGGMSVVYRARQVDTGRLVALKVILAEAHLEPEQQARYRLEAEALAHLRHPNIVQILDVGEHGCCPYLALEYIDGGSLERKLASALPSPRGAAALVETLARAVHHAHERGIVHRDLKPANILIGHRSPATGDRPERMAASHGPVADSRQPTAVKITDFGLAKHLAGAVGPTRSGTILGTPCYMAPEQAAGLSKQAGPAADVYALGAILYELLTGRPPFTGPSPWSIVEQVRSAEPVPPSQLCPKIAPGLEVICLRCLRKQPGRRYPSALALADDLGHLVDS